MKIYLDTVGCRLNQSEIESMAQQFRAAGHDIVASPEFAQLAVVNTCSVTTQAACDWRGKIGHLALQGVNEIVATGCWSTLEANAAAALPKVTRVVSNDKKDNLVADLLHLGQDVFDLEPLERQPLPGLRRRTRAFIKVQDGCDNRCTFCVTTIARGAGRSRLSAAVLADIRAALAGGTKEIVLTGVHLGSWGVELGLHLRDLVRMILNQTDTPRLRLSSLEPWDLDADFFALWKDSRLMPHLHLPLQSGCEATLKRMARKTTPRSFRDLVAAARAVDAEMAITTDVIAGFPGESEEEFQQTLTFVREMNFSGGHVFTFSPRRGTGAAQMKGQVPAPLRKSRGRILQETIAESAAAYRTRFVGQRKSVLWESVSQLGDEGWQMQGWTENYVRVQARSAAPRWNELDCVKITGSEASCLNGIIA